MENKRSNTQTAYEHNAHSSVSNTEVKDHGWSNAINQMIDQRYAFLDLQYHETGYLFRGMSTGLFDALLEQQFWHYAGDDRGSHFEKELNVILVSQDFSDALTVSKLWENNSDACIIIFKSNIFNNALAEKNAAMMATAEPGVVFKYPFLCQPLLLSEIEYIVVSAELLASLSNKSEQRKIDQADKVLSIFHQFRLENKIIEIDMSVVSFERTAVEKEILKSLSKLKIEGAKTIKSPLKPVYSKDIGTS